MNTSMKIGNETSPDTNPEGYGRSVPECPYAPNERVWASGGTAPHIPNLVTRWMEYSGVLQPRTAPGTRGAED